MGAGSTLMSVLVPVLEFIEPAVPGDIFPFFFTLEIFQRALIASILVTIVAGFLGSFLLIRNLALMGDGLAHVSFGGIAVGLVLGATSPLWYALLFSTLASILIHEMQSREILTGDASIAIFLTGVLALGLVVTQLSGGGITSEIEGYLFGSLLLIDPASFDLIVIVSIVSLLFLCLFYHVLLASAIDPISVQIQGIPVRKISLSFAIVTAAVVTSMVQVVGTLLVTALLVTPAATGQIMGGSFRSCIFWTQVFGLSSVIIGLYLSAELETGSGSMIALVTASIFSLTLISKTIIPPLIRSNLLDQ